MHAFENNLPKYAEQYNSEHGLIKSMTLYTHYHDDHNINICSFLYNLDTYNQREEHMQSMVVRAITNPVLGKGQKQCCRFLSRTQGLIAEHRRIAAICWIV